MKKIIFLLFLSCFSFFAFAQPHNFGELTIKSLNPYDRFWLFIDNVCQNEYPVNSIKINNLQYKTYSFRVELDNPIRNLMGQNVFISNKSKSNFFFIKNENGQFSLIQTNRIEKVEFTNSLQTVQHPNGGYQNNHGNYPQSPQHHDNHGHDNTPPPTMLCMNQEDFQFYLNSIVKESFDEERLEQAKLILRNNKICTEQVIKICEVFSFEKSKLEFAKFAYSYCTDNYHYERVISVFNFNSSKQELLEFIQK